MQMRKRERVGGIKAREINERGQREGGEKEIRLATNLMFISVTI